MNKTNKLNIDFVSFKDVFSEFPEHIDSIPIILAQLEINTIEIDFQEYISYTDYLLIKEKLKLKRANKEILINNSDTLIEFDVFL